MRVLVVTCAFPRNTRTHVHGGFQRLAMFVEAVGRIAELDMLLYADDRTDISPAAVAGMEDMLAAHWNVPLRLHCCRRDQPADDASVRHQYLEPALSVFRQQDYLGTSGTAQLAAFEACLARRPDAIFANGFEAMCPLLATRQRLPPVMFDIGDIPDVLLIRGLRSERTLRDRCVRLSRLPALLYGERRAVRLAQTTFVCSEADRQHLAAWWLRRGVTVAPNAVRAVKRLPPAAEPALLFLGAYWYKPNADAAALLIQRIWPRIRATIPEARLIVAGSSPESIPGREHAGPGVEFTGFVDDLESLYARARVVCAPILEGGGTRVKIIEAASYGRPIVATRVGAEGLDLRDGRELLLRDDPSAFARACIELLGDPAACRRLGEGALAVVEERYLRERVIRRIQDRLTGAHRKPDRVDPLTEAAKS